ncbi:MAG TPA: HlyD family secretion protein [Hyphomicrobiaceae bacterium]|nr:HlyD family secretion protein [Hyphomicrobiaceae bacterium]
MRLLRPVLLFGVPALAVTGALLWWLWGGRYVSTENAYVKADIVQISSEVSGRVVEVRVKDHASIKTGEVLLKIDPEPFTIALERAEAELEQMRVQVAGLRAQHAEAQAELQEAKSKIAFYDAQYARQNQLKERGVGFAFRFEEADSNAAAARDRVAVLQQKIERILASLSGDPELPPDQHPLVREKIAMRDRAKLDLDHTTVVAPVSGVAVNVKLLPGEQVRAATPLFAVVSDNRPWVEANFKETELTYVRPGQSATIVLDIYPDVTWDAQVESISPATGAEFALLPPQNASGNWVKVVQRLPVRLRLLPRAIELPLRAGMTATVVVDTKRERRITQIFGGGSAAATEP